MYGYSDDNVIPLNKEEIFKRVRQEEIFKIVTGYEPTEGEYVTSPLRENDTKAGAWYEWRNGILLFKDFADLRRVRDCFQMIMDSSNLNYPQALDYVNQYFKLGLLSGNAADIKYDVKLVTDKYKRVSLKSPDDFVKIFTKLRQFDIIDKKFWFDRYGITRDNLISDSVFPIVYYKFFSEKIKDWVIVRPHDICYAYMEFNNGHKKIYRPFGNKRSKWLTNCTENDIGGLKDLPTIGHNLIITKAYKDCRILKNLRLSTIWNQNEGQMPSIEKLHELNLFERFKNIIIFFDNDGAGITAASKFNDYINSQNPGKSKFIHLPERYLQSEIKDASDLRHKRGEQELRNFLRENKLID